MDKKKEWFAINYKPEGFKEALQALGEKIEPYLTRHEIRYCIVPSQEFDPIRWEWIYRLDAIPAQELRLPSLLDRSWRSDGR